ncbi:MAG: Mur ligase family protein [Patescibacteria group bacterium]
MARRFLKTWFRYWAAKILAKYHPRIVAITGSTGKTSTKEAILVVLRGQKEDSHIAATRGNLNTEFGVTATIIDPDFVGTEIDGRVKITWQDVGRLTWLAIQKLVRKCSYPQIFILELAADRPGDISYFMKFIVPEVGVLTNIGDVHLEFFGSKSELVEEKSLVIANVKRKGLAILNKDDDFSKLISRKTSAKKVFISAEGEGDVWASDIGFGSGGIHFSARADNHVTQIDLPVYGYQFVYAALTALTVGHYFGVPWDTMAKRLSRYTLPKSRFEVIRLAGIIVIDDTYNANPTSVTAALRSLARLGANRRKVAILGEMRELGSAHDKGHRSVGEYAAKTVDQLWVVGKGGALIKEAAVQAGLPPGQARDFSPDAISTILQDNSIVLVKGSRALRMDKIVDLFKDHLNE